MSKEAVKGLNPYPVWEEFYRLNQIPRESGHEEQIRAYILDFAKQRNIEALTDKAGNVILKKPGSPGRENRPVVILQGHLDMVCEKNRATVHDFRKDPIKLVRKEDWITADGTTLGADNGIAVAMALVALADDSLEHGPLEALFTVDEETGLVGAMGLDPSALSGKIMINLDSEEEATLYIGCAGGVNTEGTLPVEWEKSPVGMTAFQLSVTGLKGGHSGSEIHQGLANALLMEMRFLHLLRKQTGACLYRLEGGGQHNVIPRECFAGLLLPRGDIARAGRIIQEVTAGFINEWKDIEPGLKVAFEEIGETPGQVLTGESFKKAVDLVYSIPHGVVGMSRVMPGLVETSTNLAAVNLKPEHLYVLTSQRSSSNFLRDDMGDRIMACFFSAGGDSSQNNVYPGWNPNLESPILKTCKAAYIKKMGRDPEIKAIHAGLECGVIGDKIPGIDMISFGPDIRNAHSPEEKICISSTERIWNLFLEVLKSV